VEGPPPLRHRMRARAKRDDRHAERPTALQRYLSSPPATSAEVRMLNTVYTPHRADRVAPYVLPGLSSARQCTPYRRRRVPKRSFNSVFTARAPRPAWRLAGERNGPAPRSRITTSSSTLHGSAARHCARGAARLDARRLRAATLGCGLAAGRAGRAKGRPLLPGRRARLTAAHTAHARTAAISFFFFEPGSHRRISSLTMTYIYPVSYPICTVLR
jgi:hypothetical protein